MTADADPVDASPAHADQAAAAPEAVAPGDADPAEAGPVGPGAAADPDGPPPGEGAGPPAAPPLGLRTAPGAPDPLEGVAPLVGPAVVASDSPPTRAQLRSRRQADKELQGGRRRVLWWVVGVALLVVALAAVGLVVDRRLSARPPLALVQPSLAAAHPVPGTAPVMPWPTTGQGAVAIPALGVREHSATANPVPVASLTKLMTAYLILRDHPLAPGQDGPSVTMTAANVAEFDNDVGLDESNVEVTEGESLTERELLEGMLVHSANNFADALATFDAGSVAAFVVKMNAEAAAMGLRSTHYVDASGYDQGSRSTPGDQLEVAAAAMADPVFAEIVAMPSVTLPVAGTVDTYTPLLGTPGVTGIKSGFTTEAGGCDVMSFVQPLGGHPVLVLAAVTGQEGVHVLTVAGDASLALAQAAAHAVVVVQPAAAGSTVAQAHVVGQRVPVVTAAAPPPVLAWPGQQIHQRVVVTARLRAGAAAGRPVGAAAYTLGSQHVAVPVRLGGPLPRPTLLQRVF